MHFTEPPPFFLNSETSTLITRVSRVWTASSRHVEIPFGRGVCGLAAEKRRALMVPDVSRVANYLSCSPRVRSEFVVPVYLGERMAAELDIDSHTLAAFGEPDKEFLESVAEIVAELL